MARPFDTDSLQRETVRNREGHREAVRPDPAVIPAVADPGPLGMAALALTLFMFAAKQAGWMGANPPGGNGGDIWLGMGLMYGGLAQFMAGMWEFRNRNTFAATAFTSFAAMFMGLAILYFFRPAFDTAFTRADSYVVLSFFFFPWLIFAAYMTIAALRTNLAVTSVFVLLTLTLLFTWLGFANHNSPGHSLRMLGGWLGLVTAAAAWYTSAAGVINSTWGRKILPVVPMGQFLDRDNSGRGAYRDGSRHLDAQRSTEYAGRSGGSDRF